ncbi:hypothetical protein [Amycolatopsis magusensis]|uniref:hypothetical protein n=1 Tax=Amycolatopsis magusensis TaxID=882444 RepID=UPI0037A8B26A
MMSMTARSLLGALAMVTAAVAVCSCTFPEPQPPTAQPVPATTKTAMDTGFSDVVLSPCEAVPPSLRTPGAIATAAASPGAVLNKPWQPSCALWTPGDPLSWSLLLYRDYAPMRELRVLQPTAHAIHVADLDTVLYPVPTDDPATGTTCVIVTDLGPGHGFGVIAQNSAASRVADTCATAQHYLFAVFQHLRVLSP